MSAMVGPRGLGIAMLVLAAAVATPTLSAAQDPVVTAPEQPPAPLTPPAPPPAQPEQPQEPPQKQPGEKQPAKDEGTSGEAEAAAQTPAPAQVQAAATTQPGDTGARASASATVSVGDNFYSPRSVSIAAGDTVTWRNDGQVPHTATADNGSFDTGSFGPGQSRSNTFRSAGTISYYCTIHGRVQSGTVRVLAASGGGSGGGGSSGSSDNDVSEADAVAAPDAAGTSTSLPATGFAAIGLALVGFGLLAGGHLVGRLDGERRGRRRFLPTY
jgi:plastocyanin